MLRFRESPWDEAVLGKKTHELLTFDTLAELMDYEDACEQFRVGFTSCRVKGEEYDKHVALRDEYYALVGTYFHVALERAKASPAILEGMLPGDLWLRAARNDDIPAMKKAVEGYRFGPFHDDPFIATTHAVTRMKNRVDALMAEMPVVVCQTPQGVGAWMAVRGGSELVLGGTIDGRVKGTDFWSALLRLLFARGAEKVWAPISSTNLPVMNLYSKLGFRFTDTFVQFHRHRQ